MRGKVEVFVIASDGSESLVLSEPNLVVNGAGQSIVDMLTTPSSVLKYAPRVMDTSNWRWGAVSFGPAASSFQENAYFYSTASGVSSCLTQVSRDKKIRVEWVSGSIGVANGATASSYTPPYRLPSYPDPLNQKLEDASTAYAFVSGDGTQCFGQFENRINFASGDASSYFQGVYPISGSDPLYNNAGMLVSSYAGNFDPDDGGDASANMVAFFSAGASEYNANEQMDYRGFVSATHHATDQDATPLGMVYVSGSTPNGLTGSISQVAQPWVSVHTQISAPDVWAMNLFGGLHQIGLWNVDCKKSLESNEAPFLQPPEKFIEDVDGVSKLEFKLFAKKTFTQNLCYIKDYIDNQGFQNHQPLKIVWTLDFQSVPPQFND